MKTIMLDGPLSRIEIGKGERIFEDVQRIRQHVFCEEEGFREDMAVTPLDRYGIHTVLYFGNQPVACVTTIPPLRARENARSLGLSEGYIGKAAQVTKMAVLPEYRRTHLAAVMVACLEEYVFAPRGFRFAYVLLMGPHCRSEYLYQSLAGCRRIAEGRGPYGKQVILIMDRRSPTFQEIRRSLLAGKINEFLHGSQDQV